MMGMSQTMSVLAAAAALAVASSPGKHTFNTQCQTAKLKRTWNYI